MSQDQQPPLAKNAFIPWMITLLAIIFAVIVLYTSHLSPDNSSSSTNKTPHETPAIDPLHTEIDKIKQRLIEAEKLVQEVAELERVLSDAQSALAERDREKAEAQAEIKALKSSNSATTSSSLANQLSSYLKRQHTAHLIIQKDEQTIGLIISAGEQQAVLLLCEPLPDGLVSAGIELWSTSPQPQRLAVVTGATTAFSWPADVPTDGPVSLHQASADHTPGPAFARSIQVTFGK